MPVPPERERDDKRISLAPLDFEQALGGILAAGPHVEDDEAAEGKEKAPPKRRRKTPGQRPS